MRLGPREPGRRLRGGPGRVVPAHAAIVVPLLCVALAAAAQERPEAVGCYAFRPYTWSRPIEPGAVPLHVPPDTFRLYATLGTLEPGRSHSFEDGRTLVRPRMERPNWGGSLATPAAFWHEPAPDSLRVVWTNGFTGARIDARRVDGRGVGRLRWISDALPVEGRLPHADVVLDPVPCPTSLPETPTAETPARTGTGEEIP